MEPDWIPTNAEEYKVWWAENYPDIPYGHCCCGCECETPIAQGTDRRILRFKGEPIRYISYHRNSMDKKTFKTGTSDKLCACGCGGYTQYAKVNSIHAKKGEPLEYIKGHRYNGRSPQNKLTSVELKERWDMYRKWWEQTYPDIPFGTCICGCGQETGIAEANNASAGYIKGCPRLYAVGHVGRKRIRGFEGYKTEDRGYETLCWIWQLGKDKNGYGILTTRDSEGKRIGSDRAHRHFYEETYGKIEKGLDAHHLCEQRDCVNPDHILPATSAENSWYDRVTTKLTIEEVKEIKRLLRDTTLTQQTIGKKYGVTQQTILEINKGRNWKDIKI